MIQTVVQSQEGVTLLGAGEATPETVTEALTHAPTLVAVDGGSSLAAEMGLSPAAVIGDFDSIDPAVAEALPQDRLHRVDEQQTTDFEKALARVAAPFIIGLGFLGARMDHVLAAFSVLTSMREKRCLLIGSHDVILAAPNRLSLDLSPGTRLSLFPMAPVTGRSEGLKWPIDGIDFAPLGRIGTSNEVTGPIHLAFDGPGMLVIMPRAALVPALAALRG